MKPIWIILDSLANSLFLGATVYYIANDQFFKSLVVLGILVLLLKGKP